MEIMGNGATRNLASKGDHFVGDFYVLFENFRKNTNYGNNPMMHKTFFLKMVNQIVKNFSKAIKPILQWKKSKIGHDARKMLLDWEANDESTNNFGWKWTNGFMMVLTQHITT